MSISELFTSMNGIVNLVIVIALMAIGYIIKHTPALSKISNNLIPVILFVVGIVISLLLGGAPIAELVISGIINAAIAIALHQAGKNIFDLLPSTINASSTEEEEIEKDLDDETKE